MSKQNGSEMEKDARIYVAGHRGMVGSAVLRLLESRGYTNLVYRTSKELDLRDGRLVEQFFTETKPEYVIVAAAKVGGILANSTLPAEFIYDNLASAPSWWMGRVTGVVPGPPVQLTVALGAVPPNYSDFTGTSGDPAATPWATGLVTRVSVVRYSAIVDPSGQFIPPPNVLMRQVDFGAAQPVAYIEDFQVTYLRDTNANGDLGDEMDEVNPPAQKPAGGLPIAATDIVRSVRISVKARSLAGNLQGARMAAAPGEVGDAIRRTFSTMVSPRNIASGLGVRSVSTPGGPQYQ